MTRKSKEKERSKSVDEPQGDSAGAEETMVDVQTDSDVPQPDTSVSPDDENGVLREKIASLEDRLLRNSAEFDNYKKRMARQYELMTSSATDQVLSDLLEVVDNFDRAVAHSEGESNTNSLKQGMELIRNQLKGTLEKYNVVAIEALGSTFDPSLHEAMMQVESEEYEAGIVALEIGRGYKRGNRVLRFSKVGVSKGKPEAARDDEADEV